MRVVPDFVITLGTVLIGVPALVLNLVLTCLLIIIIPFYWASSAFYWATEWMIEIVGIAMIFLEDFYAGD